jgi:CheY-like chemotaxis protein
LTLSEVAPAEAVPDSINPEIARGDDLLGAEALVIEDDALVRSALVGLLGGWGVRVHEAKGLTDAQRWIQDGLKPAIILSDYRLQDGDNGIDVVQQLRRQLQTPVPACLMSGDTDGALMAAAQAAGLSLLHKPVRPAKLRNLLRRLLAGQPVGEDLR